VVVEPSEPVVVDEVAPSVASVELDSWVAPVARPAVAESRVTLEVDEPEVALVRMPKGKKRRLTVRGDVRESGDETEVMTVIPVEENREVIVAPLGPRLQTLAVPRGPRFADGPAVRGWNVVRREYWFVDRSLIGERNGMVGDSYSTRGVSARVPVRAVFGGRYVARGIRPYR